MTDPPITFTRPDQTVQMHRTAAAQAGVLAAEQAGARFLCLDLHVAVAVACGPRDALRRRHAERQGCTS